MSIEEHVLKEFSISIDIFMFFSSFEVIVLVLGGKIMTFVLYPLLRSQGIVENLEYDRLICVWRCYCVTNAKSIEMKIKEIATHLSLQSLVEYAVRNL